MARGGVEVIGAKFVEEQLAGFLPRESKNILRRTVVKIAAGVRNDIRRNAPKNEGTLRKAIKSKRNRGHKNTVEASVFIAKGKGQKHDGWYWQPDICRTCVSCLNS